MWKYKVGNNVNIVNFFEKLDCETKKFAHKIARCKLYLLIIITQLFSIDVNVTNLFPRKKYSHNNRMFVVTVRTVSETQ